MKKFISYITPIIFLSACASNVETPQVFEESDLVKISEIASETCLGAENVKSISSTEFKCK